MIIMDWIPPMVDNYDSKQAINPQGFISRIRNHSSNFYTSNGADGKMTRDVWHHLVFTGSGGKLTGYIDGELDAQVDFLEGAQVSGIYIGMANNNSAGAYHDEVGFHKVARHQRWIKATYDNQLTGSSYSSLANFAGPPFFEDTVTELYGKKNTAISNFTPTVFAGGTPAYTAAGLPPGITINSSTGEISGSTDEVGSSTFTITATGTNAAGETRTASKTYEIKISDPDSYPYKVDFTLSGYTGSSTLNQFPVLLKFDSGISGFSYNSFASATAGDLQFFASTGEELPMKLKTWTLLVLPVSGFVRVRFPEPIRSSPLPGGMRPKLPPPIMSLTAPHGPMAMTLPGTSRI